MIWYIFVSLRKVASMTRTERAANLSNILITDVVENQGFDHMPWSLYISKENKLAPTIFSEVGGNVCSLWEQNVAMEALHPMILHVP